MSNSESPIREEAYSLPLVDVWGARPVAQLVIRCGFGSYYRQVGKIRGRTNPGYITGCHSVEIPRAVLDRFARIATYR